MKNLHIKINFILFVAMITMKSNVYAADMATYKIQNLSISESFLVSSGSQVIRTYTVNREKITSVTSNTTIGGLCSGSNKKTCYMFISPVPSLGSETNWHGDINLSLCQRVTGSVPTITSFRVKNSDISWFDLSGIYALNKFYVTTDGVMDKDVQYAYNYSFDPNYTVQCPSNADELYFNSSYGGYGIVYNEKNTNENKRGLMGYSATFKLIRQGAVASIEISPAVLSCDGIIDKIISCGETFLNMSRPPSELTVRTISSIPENLELFIDDNTKTYKIDSANYNINLSNTAKVLKVSAKSNKAYKGELSLNIEATWY
ncbi:hypothetical protein ABKB29_002163 [Escherichia coli]